MRRRGSSTLITVAVLLTIILLVQTFQHAFSSRVTDQAFRTVHGRTATDLAGTACQEIRAIVERRACDPAHREFAAARGTAVGPYVRVTLDITPDELTETLRLINTEHAAAYRLIDTSAVLSARIPLFEVDPSEYEGVLLVSATVQSAADKGIVRKVGRTWMVKLVHIAPAGPLEQVTALLRRPADVLRGRFDAPELARKFMDDNLPGLVTDLTRTLANIDKQVQSASDDEKPALQQIRTIYGPLVEGADGGRIGKLLAPLTPRWKALGPLPTAGSEFVMVNRDDKLFVAELDLQGSLAVLMPKYLQLYAEVDALGKQVNATRSADAAAQALHRRYADETGQIAEIMAKIAERFIRFREKLVVVAKGDAAFDPLASAYARLDPIPRLDKYPQYSAIDRRVCYIAEDRLNGNNANDAFTRLVARLERDDSGVQGVIFVGNDSSSLTLSGTLKGRWTLVVSGSLVVDNLKRADPARDLFTIVQLTNANTTLSLSGTVDATVIAPGRKLSIAAGTQVLGGIYLDDVDSAARIETGPDGPEEIKRDPARSTGDADRRRHLVISPWTRSTSVDRNP